MIYIYRISRSKRNVKYIPYSKDKNQIKYDNVDIKNIISRISNPSVFRTLSRDSIELDYFNNIIGVTEQEYYDYYNKNTKIPSYCMASDFFVFSMDTDNEKKERSIRSFGVFNIKYDKYKNKYIHIELVVSGKPHNMKRRTKYTYFNGSDIIKTIENIAKKEGVAYIKLLSINTSISYYHTRGFKLTRYFNQQENEMTKMYMKQLVKLYSHSKKYNISYKKLIQQNMGVSNYLRRFIENINSDIKSQYDNEQEDNSYSNNDYSNTFDQDYIMYKSVN